MSEFPKKVRTITLTPEQIGRSVDARRSSETYYIKVVGLGERADYVGPSPEVYLEDGWLRIVYDPYEGSVMLNREIIPDLIRVLRKLHRHA